MLTRKKAAVGIATAGIMLLGTTGTATAANADAGGGSTKVSASQDTGAQGDQCKAHRQRGSGGSLKYVECHVRGKHAVMGTLNDTKNNGKCVRVKIKFVPSGKKKGYKDCGGKATKFHTGYHKARNATVKLKAPA